MRRTRFTLAAALFAACHAGVEDVPLTQQKIYFSDKFFDVAAIGPERALVVGYGGKILETTDGGFSFETRTSGTDLALYDVSVVGERIWISGQEGLILHSADGGKTFAPQTSGTQNYLFAIEMIDESRGFAVGDRSTLVRTTDGGKTWVAETLTPVQPEGQDPNDPDLMLAMQDPVLYDVRFLNENVGWVVGEFGRILHTTDGGATWREQQATLMGEATGIVDPMDIPTFFGVHPVSEREAIVTGLEGRIARTTDGGATWAFEPMTLDYPIVDPLYDSYVTSDGTGWAVGAAGEVVTRKAGDAAWTRANLGNPLFTWIRSVDFSDPQHGWLVGGYGNVLHTSDGGKSWRLCVG